MFGNLSIFWKPLPRCGWSALVLRGGCLPQSTIIYGTTISWTFWPFSSTAPRPVELCDPCVYHASLLSHCSKLQNLSLEGLQLSDPIVDNLAQNTNLLWLNLSGCSGFSESALKTSLSSSSRLDELNLYNFTEKHVQVAVAHVSETITQLNLSGYRKNLQRPDVSTLVGRCPNLVHLDLSDSVMLKNDCFPEFYQLNYLQYLSLSRCYDIIPKTLHELGEIPTLKTLQVFGIVPEGTLQLLKEALPHVQINCSHFTTIARPTIGNKKKQEIWGIKCLLSLEKPSCLWSLYCKMVSPLFFEQGK